MNDTFDLFELWRVLRPAEQRMLMQRIFVSVTCALESGRPGRVSVQTTNGQYHYLEISTRISTEGLSESSGSDTA